MDKEQNVVEAGMVGGATAFYAVSPIIQCVK